jgi:hypothetical protein
MTAVPSLERDKAVFARLIDIAERMQGDRWGMVADGESVRVTSLRTDGIEVALCTFTAEAQADEIDLIAGALDDLLCFVRLRARAKQEFRDLRRRLDDNAGPSLRDGDFAANAAMLCAERPFQRFLEERAAAGPIRDKDAADSALKKLLAITSKTQLNDTPDAQARWISLRGDYQSWMRS